MGTEIRFEKYERIFKDDQPRDAQGRFTSGGGGEFDHQSLKGMKLEDAHKELSSAGYKRVGGEAGMKEYEHRTQGDVIQLYHEKGRVKDTYGHGGES